MARDQAQRRGDRRAARPRRCRARAGRRAAVARKRAVEREALDRRVGAARRRRAGASAPSEAASARHHADPAAVAAARASISATSSRLDVQTGTVHRRLHLALEQARGSRSSWRSPSRLRARARAPASTNGASSAGSRSTHDAARRRRRARRGSAPESRTSPDCRCRRATRGKRGVEHEHAEHGRSQRRRRARRLVVQARHRAQQPRHLADVGVALGVEVGDQAGLAHLAVARDRRLAGRRSGCRRPPCRPSRPAPARRRPASSASRRRRACPRTFSTKQMSPSFLLRARWQMWCSTSTSVIVSSGQPAAAMQRTAQRENAFQATIRPNSSSDSSTLRGETRCDDETMPRAARLRASLGARRRRWRSVIGNPSKR